MTTIGYRDVYFSAADGLRLHLRDYGDAGSPLLPVLCLPGLTRNAIDFHDIAMRLSAGPTKRRVIAIDYRGRGLSAYDPDPSHYEAAIELGDALSALNELAIKKAIFFGTSRGGLISMGLASFSTERIAALILNDIGPEIEKIGLERIKGYVGKLPPPTTWDEAISVLQNTNVGFTTMTREDWLTMAHGTWRDRTAAEGPEPLILTYDTNLMVPLMALDLSKPLPDLWQAFDKVAPLPLLVIRGENSDLLSEQTTAEMARRHPNCAVHIVPGQGHAPLLRDEPTITRIANFVQKVDPAPVMGQDSRV